MSNKVSNLMQPIYSDQPMHPLVLTVVAKQEIPLMEGAISSSVQKSEYYICLSKLPPELRERVATAVNMMLRV
jgi:hypothetical protein